MNQLLGNSYIAVQGKDNALKVAAALIEQDYQVFIQLDDADIYIVAYANNNNSYYGGELFALINDEEQELIHNYRYKDECSKAIDLVQELIDDGTIPVDRFNHSK